MVVGVKNGKGCLILCWWVLVCSSDELPTSRVPLYRNGDASMSDDESLSSEARVYVPDC
jgi:hypothetical protein